MADAFKFIHASDFHLDVPMSGLTELPMHLKSILANAPFAAAEKVFDLALNERVDFVLLSGDLLDLDTAGPRAVAFLLSQFERLAAKDIEVYWCGGAADQPDRWPNAMELPDNVVTFSSGIVEQVDHRRGKVSLATIYGRGHHEQKNSALDFFADPNDPFPIAITHGDLETSGVDAQNIRYWGLGGRHKSSKLEKPNSLVIYPGTTQGRNPRESGAHGCKLCRVDSSGKLRVQTVETDTVRWLPQKVAINESVQLAELKEVLTERALKIATDSAEQTILSTWYLATAGEFNPAIRKREWSAELLEWLRDEFGRSEKGIWSTRLTIEPPDSLPGDWYEEDTILGEFLRALGRYQSDDSLKIALHDYLPNSVETDAYSGIGHVTGDRRDQVLRESALVGIEYLAVNREPAVLEQQ